MSVKPPAWAISAVLALSLIPATAHAAETSAVADALSWVFAQQRVLHRELTAAIRALEASADTETALWLIGASFLYGVLHAAGPGHGKAILGAYLLTHPSRVARGAALGVVSSLIQGLTAVVLVYGLIWLLGRSAADSAVAVQWSERVSYLMLAGMGAWLTFRAARTLAAHIRAAPAPANAPAHHPHDCGCGCAHVPSADRIAAASGFRSGLALALSIGLRPCSGAVLVLVFAYALKLPWAGVLAVAAMSVGTAITVTVLASLAVAARDIAAALAGSHGRLAATLGAAAALCGGLVVTLIGGALLMASFAQTRPMGVL